MTEVVQHGHLRTYQARAHVDDTPLLISQEELVIRRERMWAVWEHHRVQQPVPLRNIEPLNLVTFPTRERLADQGYYVQDGMLPAHALPLAPEVVGILGASDSEDDVVPRGCYIDMTIRPHVAVQPPPFVRAHANAHVMNMRLWGRRARAAPYQLHHRDGSWTLHRDGRVHVVQHGESSSSECDSDDSSSE